MHRQLYVRLGTGLFVAGVFVLAFSLVWLRSYSAASTGIALLVLGMVLALVGWSAPGVAPELAELFARTGYENLGRLLEELGLHTGAVYLPSSLLKAGAGALIPLTESACSRLSKGALDNRLIVFCGDAADDVGLLVTTPGTAALRLLSNPPGESMDEIAVSLTQLAVSSLRVARGIELHQYGDRIDVRFAGESPGLCWMSSAVESCLGSLNASVAAALVAEAKGRRVTITSESVTGGGRLVTLAVQGTD